MRQIDVLTSGYVSMDHIIKIASPAKVGFTSLVTNKSNARIFYGGCSVNISYALSKLGMVSLPVLRVGGDWEENGFRAFLEEGGVPLDGIKVLPEEATSVCYLLQDNNNDHITVFYPGAMDGKYAAPMNEELFQGTRLGVITVAPEKDNREFFSKCRENNVPVVFGMKDDFDAFPEAFLKELLTGRSLKRFMDSPILQSFLVLARQTLLLRLWVKMEVSAIFVRKMESARRESVSALLSR